MYDFVEQNSPGLSLHVTHDILWTGLRVLEQRWKADVGVKRKGHVLDTCCGAQARAKNRRWAGSLQKLSFK